MKKYLMLLPVAVMLFMASCTEKIDVDLNENGFQRLVVDGFITNEPTAHTVKLTLTSDYFANEAAPTANGATVTITDQTAGTTIELAENEPGVYQTAPTWAGEIGHTYELNIDYDGETYSATQLLDTVSAIDSVRSTVAFDQFTGEIYEDYRILWLWTTELEGSGNRYMWRIWQNGEEQTDTLRNVFFVDDTGIDGNDIHGVDLYWLEAEAGDTVRVQQLEISDEIYDGFIGVMLETAWRGGIFDSPPANVSTNMSNGALGFFVAAGASDYEFVIPE